MKMFATCISAGATEKLPGSRTVNVDVTAWSHDIEGHANKSVEQLFQVSTHVWMINSSRKRSWKRRETCQKFALKSH